MLESQLTYTGASLKVADANDDEETRDESTTALKTAAENFRNTAENVTNYVIKIINKVKDSTLNVTLEDVNIKANNDAALSVEGAGNTKITLSGSNTLTGGDGHAGLEHNEKSKDDNDDSVDTGKLTITSEKDSGILTATGGSGAAGIGSSNGKGTGTIEITGGNITANGGNGGNGGDNGAGIGSGSMAAGNTNIAISGGTIEEAVGGSTGDGIGGGNSSSNITVTIQGGTIKKAQGGNGGNGYGGNGIHSDSTLNISGQASIQNATGGSGKYGGDGIRSNSTLNIFGQASIQKATGGTGTTTAGSGIYSSVIDLSGSLELTAKAGSPSGRALSQKGSELVLDTIKDKLGPGAKVTATDADGKVIDQVSTPRPVEPEESSSSSDGGSAAPSAPASPLPGLTVTDKDGQRISYTSIRDNNVLSLRVGRFTASLRASLATLRQLRAEGIDTITFQTILCSTSLSVDELLAMGGEDTEVVLTHHIRSSTLTVGGKAV